ncbi:hypothetical protein [Streptomyces coryli]|nr:hypothetical protein [Streptomyces coryli]
MLYAIFLLILILLVLDEDFGGGCLILLTIGIVVLTAVGYLS